jgi:hypothetical protein
MERKKLKGSKIRGSEAPSGRYASETSARGLLIDKNRRLFIAAFFLDPSNLWLLES